MSFIDIPTEQTTAVTDAVLAILGMVVIRGLSKLQRDPLKVKIWTWAIGLITLAAALGAVAHGFKMSKEVNYAIWQPLNLSLGLAVALFAIGVIYDIKGQQLPMKTARVILWLGILFYGVTLVLPEEGFLVFILYESVAMLFALGAYIWLGTAKKLTGSWLMAAGIFVSMAAAGIQASKAVSFTLIWEFDHNGVFHLVQMPGMWLIYLGVKREIKSREVARS